jgi:hypothetical protein
VAHGGLVKAVQAAENTEPMPPRVFAADMFAMGEYSPGIAMSRSIGDSLATELGVTAQPECCEHLLDEKDKFVVLASDGLWEVFTPEGARTSRYDEWATPWGEMSSRRRDSPHQSCSACSGLHVRRGILGAEFVQGPFLSPRAKP